MEYKRLQEKTEKGMGKKQGQSSRYMQSQKFIPPTHPPRLSPHINQLQEEFDKHYIAMGMQTSKKKLVKMPDMPTDRFFIVADDTLGLPLLEGQFVALKSKVVHYPRANSAEQVIAHFKDYIGLGHFETNQQYYQINEEQVNQKENRELLIEREKTPLYTSQLPLQTIKPNIESFVEKPTSSLARNQSKIELRQISTLHEEGQIGGGCLFVYQNRKDNEQYRKLVTQIKEGFAGRGVTYIRRIDEYNSFLRLNRQHDNTILMSQYSFANLSQYFHKYKAFAVFLDQTEKINLHTQQNVALFSSVKERIFEFIIRFINHQNKSSLSPTALEEGKKIELKALPAKPQPRAQKLSTIGLSSQSPSISIFSEGKDKLGVYDKVNEKESNNLVQASPKKHKIELVRVTDLDKMKLQVLKQKAQPTITANIPTKSPSLQADIIKPKLGRDRQKTKQQLAMYKESPEGQKLQAALPLPCEQQAEHELSRSNISQRSKIKKLKSKKAAKGRIELTGQNQPPSLIEPKSPIPSVNKNDNKPNSLVKSHLRMGSDENPSRSPLQPKLLTHQRVRSDEKQVAPPYKVCINSYKPPSSESSVDEYIQPLNLEKQQTCNFEQAKPLRNGKIGLLGGKEGEEKAKLFMNQRRPSILKVKLGMPLEKAKDQRNNISRKQKLQDPSALKLMPTVNYPPPKPKYHIKDELIADFPKLESQDMEVRENIPTIKPQQSSKRYSFRQPTFTQEQNKAQLWTLQQQEAQQNKVIRRKIPQIIPQAPAQAGQQLQAYKAELKQQQMVIQPKDMHKLSNPNRVEAAQDHYGLALTIGSAHPVKKAKSINIPPIFQNNELLSYDQIDIPQISSDISSIKQTSRNGQKRPTFGMNPTPYQQTNDCMREYELVKNGDGKSEEGEEKKRKVKYLQQPRKPSGHKINPPLTIQWKAKSRSLSQVNRTFNPSFVKPYMEQVDCKGSPSNSKSNIPNIERRSSRVGKIYSNLSRKSSTSNTKVFKRQILEPPQSNISTPYAITPNNSPQLDGYFDSTRNYPWRAYCLDGPSPSRSTHGIHPQDANIHKNKSIEELIDLSKYDRVVENGIVVYRSRQPISRTYYNPNLTSLNQADNYQPYKELPIAGLNQQINKPSSIVPSKNIQQQNPYEIQRPKETSKVKPILRPSWTKPQEKENELRRSKSGRGLWRKEKEVRPTLKTEYRGEFVQENIGVQVEADPFNSLVNLNNQEVLNSSKPPNNPKSASRPLLCKAIQSTLNPIQDLLASKVSNSKSVAPQKVLNLESPNCAADSGDQSLSEEQSQSREHGADQRTVLYLIEKAQARHLFDALSALKTKRDSLITFKSEKQLSQQIAQTTHVYDLVYVLPSNPSKGIEEIVRTQPNCYLVEIGEGKTKVKGNRIEVSDPSHLKDVSELLLKHLAKPKQSHKKVQDACVCKKGLMKSPKGCWHSHVCCSMRHPPHCHS